MEVRVREMEDADRPWVRAGVEERWGLPVVTPTTVYERPEDQVGVVAEIDGERAGFVTYVRDGDEWEVVTVVAAREGVGVGRAMLEEVRRRADECGATRVWLITTDDTGAAPFYERLGMVRVRVHLDFVDAVRAHKPEVTGFRDAIELEWRLR